MISENQLINDIWEHNIANKNFPNAYFIDKKDLKEYLDSADCKIFTWGDLTDSKGISDEATIFSLDEEDAKFCGFNYIIKYENITERNEDGEPEAWELVGYDHD